MERTASPQGAMAFAGISSQACLFTPEGRYGSVAYIWVTMQSHTREQRLPAKGKP